MTGRHWSRTEDEILRDLFDRRTLAALAEEIRRTPGAVERRARMLGICDRHRVWTPEMERTLRMKYHRVPGPALATELRVSLSSIHSKAEKLGITRQIAKLPQHFWSTLEDSIISSNYGEIRPSEIARILGHSRASVYHRIDRLGLASEVGSPEYLQRQSLPRTAHPFTDPSDPGVLGYVAGIIDGEGSILRGPRSSVSVTTTTKRLATALREMVGGSVAGPYLYEKTKLFGGRRCRMRPQYHWNFTAKYHVYLLLKALLPYLVVKQCAAGQAIAYFEKRYRWGTR